MGHPGPDSQVSLHNLVELVEVFNCLLLLISPLKEFSAAIMACITLAYVHERGYFLLGSRIVECYDLPHAAETVATLHYCIMLACCCEPCLCQYVINALLTSRILTVIRSSDGPHLSLQYCFPSTLLECYNLVIST